LAKKNKDIKIYNDGKQTRDFTHINDCVKTFELLEQKIRGYEVFNSSKGSDTKIIKLAQIITKLFNSKSKIKLIQTPKHLEEFQVQKRCGNSNKIFKYLQFKPSINLTDGLKEVYL
jgi:nucleoside-diphosphate-sugar epimerase